MRDVLTLHFSLRARERIISINRGCAGEINNCAWCALQSLRPKITSKHQTDLVCRAYSYIAPKNKTVQY